MALSGVGSSLQEAAAHASGLRATLRASLAAFSLQHRFPGLHLAVLFGSQARGTSTPASDVDVAVLASGEDLLDIASELSAACGHEVDVVPLNDPGVPLLEELIRDAEPLFEASPGAFAQWRSRALAWLEIDRPWYERMRDAWLARVAEKGVS
jgi:predicted nucleotidyltransferase